MQLDIYKALKSINIEEQLVSSVIQSMEAHIDGRISQVAQPILAKLDSVQARFNGLQSSLQAKLDGVQSSLGTKIDAMAQIKGETEKASEMRAQRARWVIATAVGAVTATLTILKALGYL